MKSMIKHMLSTAMLLMALVVNVQANTTDTNQMTTKEHYQNELANASAQIEHALQKGPRSIPILNLATLNLPDGYGFVPAKETKNYFQLLGHKNMDNVVGMVVSTKEEESHWLVLISYVSSGHIMDDDAKNWNSDDLLKSLQEGTKASNEVRKERGFPALNILGWISKPHYDAQTNRLEWSIKALQEGHSMDEATINYNTLALSKEGYISMNLATDINKIEDDKSVPKTLLAALNFNEGNRYSDFNAKTDKIAEYGLAALITGVAAKKLGLIALIGAFLLKFSKIIIAAVVGIGFYITKRKKKNPTNTDKDKNQEP